MTNLEFIQSCTPEQLVKILCIINDDCNKCVARDLCREGHTGFSDWLKQDAKKGELKYAIQKAGTEAV